MTGYERSPDYGGRPVTWVTWAGIALFCVLLAGLVAWVAMSG